MRAYRGAFSGLPEMPSLAKSPEHFRGRRRSLPLRPWKPTIPWSSKHLVFLLFPLAHGRPPCRRDATCPPPKPDPHIFDTQTTSCSQTGQFSPSRGTSPSQAAPATQCDRKSRKTLPRNLQQQVPISQHLQPISSVCKHVPTSRYPATQTLGAKSISL